MTYDVVVESSARKNIDAAFRWMVTNTSYENAALWYMEIYGAMDSLRDFPITVWTCHRESVLQGRDPATHLREVPTSV